MKKHLIIVPGGGDPENHVYKQSFALIENEALRRGFDKVDILKLPGHSSYSGDELFHNQKVSSKILSSYLNELESHDVNYTILARSYGCGVVLDALSVNIFPKLLSVRLWGPVPILSLYQVILGKPENIEKAKAKGCWLNEESFNSCTPFEIQLFKYKSKVPLKIGVGTLDKYSKPSFINLLNEYIIEKPNVAITPIDGLEYEVLNKNDDYFEFIFSEL